MRDNIIAFFVYLFGASAIIGILMIYSAFS